MARIEQPDGHVGSNGEIKSVKGRADERRKLSERVAGALTLSFGSMAFIILNVVWFIVWIVINVGLIPSIEPFDPFPFGFLTMVVSLEAIALAIIVLMSQNRASKIADLREEVDLEIDRIAEAELTKVLQLVVMLAEKQGIDLAGDHEVQEMLQPSDHQKIEQALEQEVG